MREREKEKETEQNEFFDLVPDRYSIDGIEQLPADSSSDMSQGKRRRKERTLLGMAVTAVFGEGRVISFRFFLDTFGERRKKMVLRIFFTSTTGRRDIRKGQIHLFSVLSSWKYPYQAIDLGAPENERERQLLSTIAKKSDDGQVILPQIFHQDEYCGDYRDFLEAIEGEKMSNFLKQMPN